MKLALVLLVVAACVFVADSVKSYKNHRVVSFRIENEAQLKEIQGLQSMSGVIRLQQKENSILIVPPSSSLFGIRQFKST